MSRMKSVLIMAFLGTMGLGMFFGDDTPYEEREALILDGVIKYIEQIHVNPKPIDDEFSKEVFDTYLDRIDGGKRFLTSEEVEKLKVNELLIDDQVNARTLQFFDESMVYIEMGTERAKKIFSELKTEELDFTVDETIELDYDKKQYVSGYEGLKAEWRKYYKYDIVSNYNRLLKKQKKDIENKEKADKEKAEEEEDVAEKDTEALKELEEWYNMTAEDVFAKAKEESTEDIEEWFERIDKLRRSDRFETYLGAITNYYDPHTSYFNPKEKQDFDINMGGKLEGIGARLQPDGDFTKVSEIIPGGPAYKGKELEANDLILEAAQEGKEPVDFTGMRLDDVVQHIRGKKGTTVTLTIRKPDGTVKDIEIVRDRVIIDESFARSVIVDIPDMIGNIGYIKLPKFYSSFENKGGNSCAADVATEIKKLKDANVNGIVLDLRNNTGGSLNDVVQMTGLFYEDGPVVQVKPRVRKAYVHEDDDDSTLYDGPLIVMVNQNSASASEILAAALQDYGRAVIVGSTSTFGKGSVQRFFDLDRAYSGASDMKPLGNLKISVQKFYRVNGGSTQLKGVNSDIVLPDSYHFIDRGEKEYENALAWDEIAPEEYGQSVVQLDHLDEIRRNSNARVEQSQDFQLILENAQRLKENRDMSSFPLSTDKFVAMMEARDQESEKFKGLMKDDIDNLYISNLEVDKETIASNDSKKARNEEWVKGLKKDIYLVETLNIMKDMIYLEDEYAGIEKKMNENRVIRP